MHDRLVTWQSLAVIGDRVARSRGDEATRESAGNANEARRQVRVRLMDAVEVRLVRDDTADPLSHASGDVDRSDCSGR